VRLSCLARNGLQPQGKKVSPPPLRLRRSRRSRPSARSSQRESVWPARRTASSGEDVAEVGCPAQPVGRFRRRERTHGAGKGLPVAGWPLSNSQDGDHPWGWSWHRRSTYPKRATCPAISECDLSAPNRQNIFGKRAKAYPFASRLLPRRRGPKYSLSNYQGRRPSCVAACRSVPCRDEQDRRLRGQAGSVARR
jgi:hypothetical protein